MQHERYIDLIGQITERLDVPCGNIRLGIHEALAYLDRYPDQVPGRAITESDYSDITEWARNFPSRGWEGRTVLAGAGITIVPDSEPTNVDLMDSDIQEVDLHLTSRQLAKALIERGWTKGTTDDH